MQLNDGNINGMDMPQADKNDKTALQAGTNTRGRDGKLVSMQIRDYLDLLSSDAPAPGGGSVSALSAAQGAALVAMVCELTIPKEKYAQHKDLCTLVRTEITKVRDQLIEGIDRDTEAYSRVSAAFKMAKDTDEQKKARSKAIQKATAEATRVPYETMEICLKGLDITAEIVGRSNPNAASDLGVAALNLLAGLKGAYLNVMINLPGIKDEKIREEFDNAAGMVKEAEAKAADIYSKVMAAL